MKILLVAVNAKYIHSNLAVYSLKSYASKYKEQIEIAEYTINNYVDDILGDIYKRKPDMVGFSCYIWNISMIDEIARELRKILPDVKIWFGGPEVSYDAKERLLEKTYIDGIFVGEGEDSFLEVLTYYIENMGNLSEIKGIAYRENASLPGVLTDSREQLNLSLVPFPYADIEAFHNKIIYYETSRGCPYSCSYCLSSIDRKVRFRDIDLVKRELQIFLDHNTAQVKFIDRTFNCNHSHAMAIWEYIKEHDNGITNFHFEISADLLTLEELDLLNSLRVGLVQLEIGVQSTNQDTIEAIHRKMDLDKLAFAVNRIHEGHNIHQHLDLIVGLPYEDYDSFRNSFQEVYHLRPDQLQLGFLKVLKGSHMCEVSKEHQIVYKSTPPYEVMCTKWLSYDEVLKLKQVEEMVEIYHNSGQFTNSIHYLEHKYQNPFDLYKALGDFYEQGNLLSISHARINRYHILLEFAREFEKERDHHFAELLVYDLYLREKMKSRPSFASEVTELDKKWCWDFYNENCNKSHYLKGYEEYNSKQISRMTHIEHFSIDILETVRSGAFVMKDHYVLFDYENRSPLGCEANTVDLDPSLNG